ncbi:MAG: hypothetical protein Q9220_004435 [cf. Caloplaca sp. 1 TL-2023]
MNNDLRHPQVGATFTPGGIDDFYMPELVSPAPNRVMPELPDNIQNDLARLELNGMSPQANRLSGLQSPSPVAGIGDASKQMFRSGAILNQPTFSPFPRLERRPPNVPPSDEEKEAILENARLPVLNSTDPEMQLTWAQDAFSYVEIASQDAAKLSDGQAARSQTPRTEHQLRVDAVNVVSFLAEQHHPKAEFMRGMWLEFGKFNFRMDKKEAFRCYSRAAQKGYARAEYRIGMQFESSNDPSKALTHYVRGVDAGDSASTYSQRLGMMALLGQHGQQLDYDRGVDLIRRAADTADENAPQGAYYKVFGMLQAKELKQISVPDRLLPTDLIGARHYIEKAAYLGFAKAQTKMGAAYEHGQLGCDFDPALSLHYNALASRQGEPEADMAISKWFLCGQKDLFEKNDDFAFMYAERAAQTGFPTAEFAMGYFYEVGIHVRSDLSKSKAWYTKAADHGYAEAVGRIEGIARSNTLSKKDHQDVAIARIRSMHGSQRAPRPDRSRPSTQMPTILDSKQEAPMLNPTRPYPQAQQSYVAPSMGRPQRPISAAPYPEDAMSDPRPGPRPNTVAPYSNPNLRVRPDMRPSSVATAFSPPANDVFGSPSITPMRPPRSFSSQDNPALGGGRGRGASSYHAGFSSPSTGGYRQPNSSLNAQTSGPPSPAPSTPQPPGVDVGFSAPLDPSGADRKGRLQKSGNRPLGEASPTSKPLPAPMAPNDRRPQRLSSLPDTQGFTRPARNTSPVRQPNSRPGSSHGSQAGGGGIVRPSEASPAPALPPKVPASDGPAPTPPPSSTSRPPGKGPKTFEEMGVPAQKQKDECYNMGIFDDQNSPVNQQSAQPTRITHLDTQVMDNTIPAQGKSGSSANSSTMSGHANELKEQLEALRGNERLLKANVATLEASPTTNDIQANISVLELEKEELMERLEKLRSGKVEAVSPAEREAVEKERIDWMRKAESRKRVFMEMWAIAGDRLPTGQTKAQLWDELGLEDDEAE